LAIKPRRLAFFIFPFSLFLLPFTTGCSTTSSPVTLTDWQDSVEAYIWQQANGDPNALRNMTWDATHKGFSVLANPLPEHSTDVHGLLLAHPTVAGQTWFVFLVGQVEKQNLTDLRLAALSPQGPKFIWHITPTNPQSLQTYRQHRPADSNSPLPFPDPADLFNLSIANNHLTATHQQSHAQWTLTLP
jgi:hypothetical protein